MFELLLTMLERLGIIVTIAFILTRLQFFRNMIYQKQLNRSQQYKAIIFFGFFGIIGTYSGLSLDTESLQFNRWASSLTSDEALANSRVIGVVIAGLLGGYKIGIGAGLIAGIHRFTLGGFTAFSCGFAAILAGIIGGFFYKKNKQVTLKKALLIGSTAEAFQMLIILLLSRPFDKSLALVEMIGVPMILANGLGCALILLIIKNVVNEEEKAGAIQAQKTLRIADQTLAYLHKGMNKDSAEAVCKILQQEIPTTAVSMSNLTETLAHVGACNSHHHNKKTIQSNIAELNVRDGNLIITNKEQVQCNMKNCPLVVSVVTPLKQRGKMIGTLKFYFHEEKEVTPLAQELISGLSVLLSNQLAIAEADKAYQLAKESEIKALQAQISPHFLFNSMNTIVSLIRLDPARARKLLISLSQFLRQNLAATTMSLTTLEQELKHVKAYLEIEKTRFIEKLDVIYDIDEDALAINIPPLTLQPIIENAIKHGIKNKVNDCFIKISVKTHGKMIKVTVEDNGQGMSDERSLTIGKEFINSEDGTGMALYNINRRLTMLFGNEASLQANSQLNKGTLITFTLSRMEELQNGTDNKSANRR